LTELNVENLSKSYDKKNYILKKLNFKIHDGELVSILGPSGCGKTTTLRIIAGLLEQTDGNILVDNSDVSNVPVHKRNFGMVFQSYALFPHLTVFENVAFGLKRRHETIEDIKNKVAKMLRITGLEKLAQRLPKELSGGQQQRVSLARALVVNPRLLLMDEPLSNLDDKLRISMRDEIRKLQQELHITSIFVTHDQEECFAISDRVAVMNNGRIEQFDTPQMIYNHPKTIFVAQFIGYSNFLKVDQISENNKFLVQGVELTCSQKSSNATCLTIRPDRIKFGKGANTIEGIISSVTYLGTAYRYIINTKIGELKIDWPGERIELNQKVTLHLDENALIPLEG
jgi:ABC-type spermidine/putrescine transport systems, ATPase components